MKRPDRVPSQLSESLHKRLSAYALAASAAGVGVLALAQPAEAKIVYTPIHHVIKPNGHYNLDLNNDGIVDFVIVNKFACSHGCSDAVYLGYSSNSRGRASFIGRSFGTGFGAKVFALRKGGTIGASRPFLGGTGNNMAYAGLSAQWAFTSGGDWAGVSDRFLGMRITVSHQRYYGWARMSVRIDSKTAKITATLTGYAYETIPNKKIIAGQTHGKDEATLGRLAQGASGVSREKK